MGCCLAALISDFPLAEKCTSKATTTFLAKIAKGEEDSTEEMALLNRSAREDEGFVSYDDPGASIDASMTQWKCSGFFKNRNWCTAPTAVSHPSYEGGKSICQEKKSCHRNQ
jgi:hypothetical protein